MKEKILEQLLDGINSLDYEEDDMSFDKEQKDLFNILMGRCPPTGG